MIMELCLATLECWSLPDHIEMVIQNKWSTDDLAYVGIRPLIGEQNINNTLYIVI